MRRLSDPAELHRLIHRNARDDWKPGLEQCAEWLTSPGNFALVEGDDLSMFSGVLPVLHGHLFFASRGKEALTIARAMLDHVFGLGATAVTGRTPAKYRDAVLFARWLGFVKTGEEETPFGRVILSRLDANPQAPISVA